MEYPTFTIDEIEKAFTDWNKACGVSDSVTACAWHDFFVRLIPVGTNKMIEKECTDEIKTVLYKWAIGHISRGVAGGLPEWYKKKLLESQFATTPEAPLTA